MNLSQSLMVKKLMESGNYFYSEPNNEINVAAIEMELVYNGSEQVLTLQTNTSEFSPSASMGSSLQVSPSSTGIITIPVSLSRNQTIQDLDFEISLDGQ